MTPARSITVFTHARPGDTEPPLRRIAELTSLDPGEPRDLVMLELALARRKLGQT